MNKKLIFITLAAILSAVVAALWAQENTVVIKLFGSQKPAIAVPDLHGSGAAQGFMGAFNETLFGDLQYSGLLTMAP